jgi:hypothetical protein
MAVSYRAKTDNINDKKIDKVDKMQEPFIPIKRPRHVHDKKLKNGKTRIQKYILK